MTETIPVRVQHKRMSASDWASSPLVLLDGELGIESDTGKVKVGNGRDRFSALQYLTGPKGCLLYTSAKVKVNGVVQYPEFRFGQNPDSFYGMKSDINKNLTVTGGTAETDHAIVGDFQNRFKWGYSENIPMEIIEYGDPDGAGRDLKAYNEICLRAEAFIGWGILDEDAFARVKA